MIIGVIKYNYNRLGIIISIISIISIIITIISESTGVIIIIITITLLGYNYKAQV